MCTGDCDLCTAYGCCLAGSRECAFELASDDVLRLRLFELLQKGVDSTASGAMADKLMHHLEKTTLLWEDGHMIQVPGQYFTWDESKYTYIKGKTSPVRIIRVKIVASKLPIMDIIQLVCRHTDGVTLEDVRGVRWVDGKLEIDFRNLEQQIEELTC